MSRLDDALAGVTRIGLDTMSPIYSYAGCQYLGACSVPLFV